MENVLQSDSPIGKERLKGFYGFTLSFEVGKTKEGKNNARVWQKCCMKIAKYGKQKFKVYTIYCNILQAMFYASVVYIYISPYVHEVSHSVQLVLIAMYSSTFTNHTTELL